MKEPFRNENILLLFLIVLLWVSPIVFIDR